MFEGWSDAALTGLFTVTGALVGVLGMALAAATSSIAEAIAYWARARRTRQRHLGRILWTLLEVRHRVWGTHAVLEALRQEFAPSKGDALFFEWFTGQLGGGPPEEEYRSAVAAIARDLPLLAHELHDREQAWRVPLEMLESLHKLKLDGPHLIALANFTHGLKPRVVATLDELASAVAWQHGIATWLRLKAKRTRGDRVDDLRALLAEWRSSLPPDLQAQAERDLRRLRAESGAGSSPQTSQAAGEGVASDIAVAPTSEDRDGHPALKP